MTSTSVIDDEDHPHSRSDDTTSHKSIGKRSRDQLEKPSKIPASIKSCNECRQQKVSIRGIRRQCILANTAT